MAFDGMAKSLIDSFGVQITIFESAGNTYGVHRGLPDDAVGGVSIKAYFYKPENAGYTSSKLLDQDDEFGPKRLMKNVMLSSPGFVPSIATRIKDQFGATWAVVNPNLESAMNGLAYYDLTVEQVDPSAGRLG